MEWSAKYNGYVDESGVPVRPARGWSLHRRLLLFVCLVAGLNSLWSSATETRVERIVIDQLTVKPAAFLINLITPDVGARAVGWSIKAAGGGLNIQVGCDGLEVMFLMTAAFLVAPITSAIRVIGLTVGLIFVYFLNQGRILALFYVNRVDKSLFDMLHTTALPLMLIMFIAIYFYACLVYDRRITAQPA